MSVFCLNCRGLGDPRAVDNLRLVLRRNSPSLVFLSETKLSVAGMDSVKRKLGHLDGIAVDCRGRSGGVALLWEKSTKVSLLSCSSHHIDVAVQDVGGQESWRFTGIYGWAESANKSKTCELLADLHQHSNLPWLVGGDLNEVLYNFEKKGGGQKSQHILDLFRDTLEGCGLYDLGFTGYEFTWENRRGAGAVIEERLDGFCASTEWSALFPEAEVRHLDECFSDHLPIFLKLMGSRVRYRSGRKRFRFENMWIQEESCRQIIQRVWESPSSEDPWLRVEEKLEQCSAALSTWARDTFGEVQENIRGLVGRLQMERDILRRRAILKEIGAWRRKEEVFWAQRAKSEFLLHGDANTKWFHARAQMRRKNNTIVRLQKGDGSWAETADELQRLVVDYFSQLFSTVRPEHVEEVLSVVPNRVTEEMNDMLMQPYSDSEIYEALKMMGPTKSPGPDGFNALFFQQYWDIVGKEVLALVKDVLAGGRSPSHINHTNVVLIPKLKSPTQVSEFRPISLCNVVYKLITKVIASRLKKILPHIISDTQSAFIPGRLITDNVLIAYEVFHSMINQRRRNGTMAIKVDMSKAYDRVEWGFLRRVMLKLGFHSDWVQMVMGCVETATFSFVINGTAQGWVRASRGLRQGDPVSPYLFLFVTEGLIGLLRRAEVNSDITGHQICRGAPSISHLLFADDSLFFCKASIDQARAVRRVLSLYESASGQQVNAGKSSISFGRGIPRHRKEEIIQELEIREVLSHEKYLGLPTHVGKSRVRAFISLKDRVGQRLSGWSNKMISWAGREVLIKAVAQAVPIYAMSIFKLPKDFCSSLQAMINRFWWGHDPDKRKIHRVGSDRLCASKREGGLGFRHLESFNDAMLAKQVWRLIQNPDSLVARLLKSKYYPTSTIVDAALGVNPSFTWRSLHGVFWVIERGSRWIVGNGDNLFAWSSRWLPRPFSFLPIPWRHDIVRETRVADFIDKGAGCWKEQLVRHLFIPCDADQIL